VFGEGVYVGHDEPSLLFYSNKPGSGNQYSSTVTLPSDPPPNNTPAVKTYNFELRPAFWFGMAMCDTQSYPELVNTCIPDSDLNIIDPSQSPYHAGEAFTEMQFYPPGWVPWPAGISCSATQWCAALNIDSLSENPVTGQTLNTSCTNRIGSIEYVNFAFITKNGVPQAPPNPVDATLATYTPDPSKDLMMNSGDKVTMTMHDTSHGLRVDLKDLTTGQSGYMVASAANDFAQVQYAPDPSTTCNAIPYDFHPMYSTSSEKTRVVWAAHTYNIAFSDEIGHFDFCTQVTSSGGCSGQEGAGSHKEKTDSDDVACFPGSASTLVMVNGCIGANVPGFDGTSYLDDWPNGDPNRPTPIEFTSFLTGSSYTTNYSRVAFETDLPRVEEGLYGCDPYNQVDCTLLPITDDGNAAAFYPYYTISSRNNSCIWVYGNTVPGLTTDNFGKNQQYGTYDYGVQYTGPGVTPYVKSDDFRNILGTNPCPA
jgi:hypothetical protein